MFIIGFALFMKLPSVGVGATMVGGDVSVDGVSVCNPLLIKSKTSTVLRVLFTIKTSSICPLNALAPVSEPILNSVLEIGT